MTDITDIAALSYARLIEVRNILSGFEDGYDTAADRENYEAMRDAQALIDELISARWQLLTVTTRLEAERQRADYRQQVINQRNAECDRLINEITALKGDQVPVAVMDIQHGRADGNLFAVTLTKAGHALKDDVYELFTAPQKPVLLPHGYKPYLVRSQTTATRAAMTSGGEWLHRDEVTAAIVAAGGTVAGHNDKVDITCWSCRRFITFQQHAEADGFCTHCSVEIELDDKDGE